MAVGKKAGFPGRWADHVARGKDDRPQTFTKAEFIEGGTIGPAKER